MKALTCISKTVDQYGNVVSYEFDRGISDIEAKKVQDLLNNKINVLNMKLDKENRIICNNVKIKHCIRKDEITVNIINSLKFNSNSKLSFRVVKNVNEYISKAKMIGYSVNKCDNINVLNLDKEQICISEVGFEIIKANSLFAFTKFDSIDFTNVDTSKVTSMQGMFEECSVKHLNLDSFDTKNVYNMSYMFRRCKGLDKLDLKNFNTINVKSMKRMFSMCVIDELVLSYFYIDNVIDINGMLSKSKINNLKMFRASKKINLQNIFYNSKINNIL